MAAIQIYSRIFLFYNLIYSIFLSFLPKTLHHYLPKSPPNQPQQLKNDIIPQEPQHEIKTDTVPPRSPRMNPDQLNQIFQLFDKNSDGKITKQELNHSLQNMSIFISESDIDQLIEKIDVNGDGCVDMDEFGDLYKAIMDDRDDEEDMRDAFNVFDQNRDGFIAVEELRSVLESLGVKQGKKLEDCEKMIRKVDVDGDGVVSFGEFKEMMRLGGFVNLDQN